MSKNLVIVESPAKAKTLKKYLGKDFDILASYGHVRDLVPKEGAVDTEHEFAMKYQVIEKNAKHVDEICAQLKKSDALYLATDPDREGEAISWHLYELVKHKKALEGKPVHRVVFHEITKTAVQAAIQKPRTLSMDLVNAQQARRALDYLVGFNLSPLLWKKIRRGLSAGRVQSPALRMIVEREEEIEKFKSQEHWTIETDLKAKKQPFSARLVEYGGKKLEQFSITNQVDAKAIEEALSTLAKGQLKVEKINKSQRKRNPAAPFTTSTLQQEASRKLGFSTQKTMRVAQQLYEGIDVGEGAAGLITYMRTDSLNLSNEAITEIRGLIVTRFGKEALPSAPRLYKTKSKNAQEAHEAIRPTVAQMLPENIKGSLTNDQYKLYNLIWKRTIACQMMHAIIDGVAVDLSCGEGNRFRANGSIVSSPGFMQIYLEGVDEENNNGAEKEEGERMLPPMSEGEWVDLLAMHAEQHFTEPPPRYSEASLVKALEEYGIGRPSTYASIISTLQQRTYVVLENRRFKPTDVGRIVNKFLTQYFNQYVDYDFTARLEDELDEKCPKCDKELSIRLGKRGRFIGCTGYPECDYTRNLEEDREASLQPQFVEGRRCPQCESELVIKQGRYGKFIGCSQYPKCKHIESLEKPEDTAVTCPQCQKGSLVKRKSRYGTFFYSCNQYPDCKYAVNNPPIDQTCPKCQWPILTIKTTKRRGTEKACPQKTCGFTEKYEVSNYTEG